MASASAGVPASTSAGIGPSSAGVPAPTSAGIGDPVAPDIFDIKDDVFNDPVIPPNPVDDNELITDTEGAGERFDIDDDRLFNDPIVPVCEVTYDPAIGKRGESVTFHCPRSKDKAIYFQSYVKQLKQQVPEPEAKVASK